MSAVSPDRARAQLASPDRDKRGAHGGRASRSAPLSVRPDTRSANYATSLKSAASSRAAAEGLLHLAVDLADAALGDAEDVADLGERQVLDVEQHGDLALALRQLGEGGAELLLGLLGRRGVLGVDAVVGRRERVDALDRRLVVGERRACSALAEAAGMGLMWGAVGLVPGFLMEGVDPDGVYADIWPAVFPGPLLFGGVTFYLLFRVLGRGRRLAQVSMGSAALWGALASLALAALFSFALFIGFARWHGEPPHLGLRLAKVAARECFIRICGRWMPDGAGGEKE